MIRIGFTESAHGIETMKIKGHAYAGDYGKDLVCCAVSSIAISGINAIDELFPGKCELECADNRIGLRVIENSDDLQVALKMLQVQLRCMAETDPKHVSLDIK